MAAASEFIAEIEESEYPEFARLIHDLPPTHAEFVAHEHLRAGRAFNPGTVKASVAEFGAFAIKNLRPYMDTLIWPDLSWFIHERGTGKLIPYPRPAHGGFEAKMIYPESREPPHPHLDP